MWSQYHIRWMIRADMRDVLRIERDSHRYPWTEREFIDALRCYANIGMVCEKGERVLGYVVYQLHKQRLELLNFAVDPQFRRRGVGAALIRKMIGKLDVRRRGRIVLHVTEENRDAQLFFREMGFRAEKTIHDYFCHGESAYRMVYRLDEGREVIDRIMRGDCRARAM